MFSSVVTNNPDVQEFACKEGAINLAVLLEREKTPQMREAILGCLSAFLKGSNFVGKRIYIEKCDGLTQLISWTCVQGDDEKEKYGEGAILRKIKLKLKILLNDFVLNDDNINEATPTLVRDTCCNVERLLNNLAETIKNADLEAAQEF